MMAVSCQRIVLSVDEWSPHVFVAPISMKDVGHIPSYVYIYKLHVLLCVCKHTYIYIIKHKNRNERRENNLFLYPTLEAIALHSGEQRNNFKLVELIPCLCFRLTTQVTIWDEVLDSEEGCVYMREK